MSRLFLHAGHLIGNAESAGSPLYDILPEHYAAALAVLALPLLLWLVWHRPGIISLRTKLSALPADHRLTAWLLGISGLIHLALLVGHDLSAYSLLYAGDAIALFWVAGRIVEAKRWRAPTALILIGSIVGYGVSLIGGQPPDQLGLATKLAELAALTITLTPAPGRPVLRLLGSSTVVVLVLLTGTAAWAGAFVAAETEGGHHQGVFAAPGSVIPPVPDRHPTVAETARAGAVYKATVAATAKYVDPATAAKVGYLVAGISGTDFHATNPTYQADGIILDPQRPENLIYAETATGPVLVGVMFEVPFGESGPTIGGPLTVWHGHEQVCFSVSGLAGLTSPFGACPLGSLTLPLTNEMIHMWVLPGAPVQWGDLDSDWLASYLEQNAS